MSVQDSDEVKFGGFSFKNLWRLLSYVKPYRRLLLVTALFALLTRAGFVYAPYLVAEVWGGLSDVKGSGLTLDGIAFLVGAFLLVSCVGFLFEVLSTLLAEQLGQKIIYDLRTELFTHLIKKPMMFFQRHPVGRLVTRVSFDLENVSEMFTKVIMGFALDLLKVFALLIVFFILDWRMALLTTACLPVMAVMTLIFLKYSRPVYLEERRATSAINAFLAERLGGLKVIRIFATRERQIKKMRELVKEHLGFMLGMLHLNSWYQPAMAYVGHMMKMFILYLGASFLLANQVDEQINWLVFFYFFWTLDHFFEPIRDLAVNINIMQIAMASSERVFDLLDDDESLDDSKEKVEDDIKGQIEFKDVRFSYIEGEEILKGISFKVKPGEKIALVGSTGAGKTTVTRLLQRFSDIDSGEILIDNIPVNEWKRSSLRQQIGSVQQDVTLFSGSLRHNITLDNDEISEQRIEEAMKASGADSILEGLTEGLDTDIRERGNLLSVGQKQLLSFARVMVARPKILILDEATAHIDSESEAIIQNAMSHISEGKTCFIIAHRLSTIQFCDRIFVIEDGLLVEEGSHNELLKQKGHYENFYRSQFEDS